MKKIQRSKRGVISRKVEGTCSCCLISVNLIALRIFYSTGMLQSISDAEPGPVTLLGQICYFEIPLVTAFG